MPSGDSPSNWSSKLRTTCVKIALELKFDGNGVKSHIATVRIPNAMRANESRLHQPLRVLSLAKAFPSKDRNEGSSVWLRNVVELRFNSNSLIIFRATELRNAA